MSERIQKEIWLKHVGELIREKRYALGREFQSREFFVMDRSENLFQYEEWISTRYLASIELGNNQMSIEKLIQIAYALEIDPADLFTDVVKIYQENAHAQEKSMRQLE